MFGRSENLLQGQSLAEPQPEQNQNRTGRLLEVRVNRTRDNVSSTRWTGVRARTLQNFLYPDGEQEIVRVSDGLGASGPVWGVLERPRSCSESSQR